jgi:hypothetical protein
MLWNEAPVKTVKKIRLLFKLLKNKLSFFIKNLEVISRISAGTLKELPQAFENNDLYRIRNKVIDEDGE